jgi:hypothetical protein
VKKWLVLVMIMLTWIVYLKNGDQICAEKVDTGRFQFVHIITCDGKEILIPRENVSSIEKK